MAHKIIEVIIDSPADMAGIKKSDVLLQINDEDVIDQVDYQALSTVSKLTLLVENPLGEKRRVAIFKDEYDPLGLKLEDTLLSKPRQCANQCVFCFIDQMPPRLRETLYIKDDDWRLSLMMGNYVTLTNVSDKELDRIIARKASPLYISIHTTNPAVRVEMMNSPRANQIMEKLHKLVNAGIKFHAQIVLCPGINDGEILMQTIEDLTSFYPLAQSMALVPVGLTAYREGLFPLTAYTQKTAKELIDQITPVQKELLKSVGTRFVFIADEFYAMAQEDIPQGEAYEEYHQIENGVGLVRMFMDQVQQAKEDENYLDYVDNMVEAKEIIIACGTSIAPYLQALVDQYHKKGVKVRVMPIKNTFFGETVTVTGLITGQDLVKQLSGVQAEAICIVDAMLRREGDLFLDNMSLKELREKMHIPIYVVENDGETFYKILQGKIENVY